MSQTLIPPTPLQAQPLSSKVTRIPKTNQHLLNWPERWTGRSTYVLGCALTGGVKGEKVHAYLSNISILHIKILKHNF